MLSLRPRAGARLAAGSTALVVALGLAAPAMATPSGSAGTWLSHQIGRTGLVHNDQYGFDDYGLTIDTALGLQAARGRTKKVIKARDAVAEHVDSYTTGVDWGSSDVYAGATAKAALFAQLTGGRARAFGGVNLVHRLAGLISSTAPTTGRLEDRTTGTDYANVLGQAYAARALDRAGHPKAKPALRFLLEQQCPGGWFRLNFSPKTGPQSCARAAADTRVPDTDATATAVVQLSALSRQTRAVRSAERLAVRWLAGQQRSNGSFGGGVATAGSNSNSTGLAAAALATGGRCDRVARGGRWLQRLQVTSSSPAALAHEIGAVAYDRAAFRSASSSGIDTASRDQWRRSTAQAVLGLVAAAHCR